MCSTVLIAVVVMGLAYNPIVLGLEVKIILEQPLKVPSLDVVATTLVLILEPADIGVPAHYHSGPVAGYVIEGEFLFQVNDEPPRVISAGNTFYEKYHDNHVWGANASNTTICRVLATIFGHPDEELTVLIPDYKRESWGEALSKARSTEQ